LRLIFQHLPEEERGQRVANALGLIERHELDAQGVTVVRRGARLVGAMVSMVLPGAAGLVWPPQATPGAGRLAVEDALVGHAIDWLRRENARLAQSILTPVETGLAEPLTRNGFRHVTRLRYLRHDLSGPPPDRAGAASVAADPDIRFYSFPACDPSVFAATLVRTYEGTLDCPEVNGVRTPQEILTGHAAQGSHDPNRWWLVRRLGAPVAVLLLTGMPEWQGLDIAYLGVVPEARRLGLGRALTHRALLEARWAGVRWLTLAVDQRNLPACEMYQAAGFALDGQRDVYLAIWNPASGTCR